MQQGHTESLVVAALLAMLEGSWEAARSLLTSYFLAFEEAGAGAAAPQPATAAAGAAPGGVTAGAAEATEPAASESALEFPRPAAFDPLALYALYTAQARGDGGEGLRPLHCPGKGLGRWGGRKRAPHLPPLSLLPQLQALRSPSAPSWRRAQTADTLRAVRCFPAIAERLGPGDSLDAKVPDAEFDATAAVVGGGGVEVDEQARGGQAVRC